MGSRQQGAPGREVLLQQLRHEAVVGEACTVFAELLRMVEQLVLERDRQRDTPELTSAFQDKLLRARAAHQSLMGVRIAPSTVLAVANGTDG